MSNYPTKTEKTAKSIDEAIEAALTELNISKEDADIDIIDEGSKGFLGLGAKDAVVRVSVKAPEIAKAKEFLGDIFKAMNMEVEINATCDDEMLSIDLAGDNMGIIIGKRGDTLDSLQYLTSLVVNSRNEKYKKVTIDTENYREKRNEALLALAERLAKKVEKSGKKYTLEPMNPYERRIIHSTLQDNAAVTTFSIGEDPYRKVVIAPKDRVGGPRRSTAPRRSRPTETVQKEQPAPATPSPATEAAFIDYANYAKERAARPKAVKAGSYDEYLEKQKNAEE